MDNKRQIQADSESFITVVRKKYETVDKDAVEKALEKDKEEMQEDDFQEYGNPPGIYWYNQDYKERNAHVKKR